MAERKAGVNVAEQASQRDCSQPAPASDGMHRAALGALVLCAMLWSLNGPLIKLLVRDGVSGVKMACARSLFGGLVLLPFAWRHRRSIRNVPARRTLATILAFGVMTVTFVIATTKTAASSAVVLQYTSPVWVFLLSPMMLGERPHARDAAALGLAMVGVAVIFAAHPSRELPWLGVALLSGLAYGVLTILLRAMRPVEPIVVAAANTLGSGLLALVWVLATDSVSMTPYQFLLMGVLGVVQFASPYVLFSWALRRVEAHKASLIVLSETMFNPVLTWLVVSEAVPRATLLGGPLIVAAVAASMLRSKAADSTNHAAL